MSQKRKFTHSQAPRKRVRSDAPLSISALSDPSSLPPRAIEQVQATIHSALKTGRKHVFRALKKARDFETRKLVRRIKTARTKGDEAAVARCEEELAAAKASMDFEALAEKHMLKVLGKSRQVVGSPLWPVGLQVDKEDEGDRARRNVLARVYGSKGVKEAVEKLAGDVRGLMGLESEGTLKAKSAAIAAAKAEEDDDDDDDEEEEEEGVDGVDDADGDVVMQDSDEAIALAEANSQGEESGNTEYESWHGFSPSDDNDKGTDADTEDSEGDDDGDPWDHLDNDDVFAEFDDRLAASSTDDGDDDSSLQNDDLNRTGDEWSGSENEEQSQSSGSDTETPSSQRPKPILKKTKQASPLPAPKKTRAKPAAPATSTTSQFLPTLMAGYISGSSSDPDAHYNKNQKKKKGPPEKAERKNRMGQQARRALWEKKFGKMANHVKKEAPKGRGANAINIEDTGRGGRANGAPGRGGYAGGVGRGKPKVDEGPLHPSWEAARKAKEKQANMAEAIKTPIGKKITFD